MSQRPAVFLMDQREQNGLVVGSNVCLCVSMWAPSCRFQFWHLARGFTTVSACQWYKPQVVREAFRNHLRRNGGEHTRRLFHWWGFTGSLFSGYVQFQCSDHCNVFVFQVIINEQWRARYIELHHIQHSAHSLYQMNEIVCSWTSTIVKLSQCVRMIHQIIQWKERQGSSSARAVIVWWLHAAVSIYCTHNIMK